MQRVRTHCYFFAFYTSTPFFDLLERVRVHLLIYEVHGVWVWVEISHCFSRCEHTVRQVLCKRRVYADFDTRDHRYVCTFEHNFAVVYRKWRVSTKLYQLRHVTTRKFSLKRDVSAPFSLTKTCICATIIISHHAFHLASRRYTRILIPPRDFWTYKSFDEIDWQGARTYPPLTLS